MLTAKERIAHNMDAPCKNCDRRTETCHDYCKAYKAYDARCKAIREARLEEQRGSIERHHGKEKK
jgi:hypothetical protein